MKKEIMLQNVSNMLNFHKLIIVRRQHPKLPKVSRCLAFKSKKLNVHLFSCYELYFGKSTLENTPAPEIFLGCYTNYLEFIR
jgi:hypothetical protein